MQFHERDFGSLSEVRTLSYFGFIFFFKPPGSQIGRPMEMYARHVMNIVHAWWERFTYPLITYYWTVLPNLGPLISRWEINKFENWWYRSVRILEVLKLVFQQFLNLSSSQRDMSGPILGALSNNRWLWGTVHALAWEKYPGREWATLLPVNCVN
jgi:hypothetical protein